jgi:N-methylhydantoinase A
MPDSRYIVYIDNGGTFTDSVIAKSDGTVVTGKASTIPTRLQDSFFASIEDAAGRMGESIANIISKADVIGYGCTLGTNIIVSQQKGPKLGLITTRGIEDRTIIMRHRAAGLSRSEAMHLISADKPEPIIPRNLIRGVTERIDVSGDLIIPLRETEAAQAVNELLEEGVEGIAVGFLWSFLNDIHEKRMREIIQELAPHVSVALSSEIVGVAREYPRFMSTIFDLYIGKPLRELLAEIKNRLTKYSYNKPLLVMQAFGGVARSEMVRPGTTLHSGPVGGLLGVEFMKNLYGIKNAMGSDVGGTSFDITVSPEGSRTYLREPIVGRFEIGTPMCEITTIGAGGGTIARFHQPSQTIRVGPESAEAIPGPVCYDSGGIEPTVTDADVALNRIDPGFFLGGKIKLNREKAIAAIEEKIAGPMKMKVEEAAEAICNIVDAQMGALLKSTIARKGIDPSKYTLFVFGGAGATHCAGYSNKLGFSKLIIPSQSATFSAFGASTSDIRHRLEVSPFISIPEFPYDAVSLKFDPDQLSLERVPVAMIERFNTMLRDISSRIDIDMEAEGFKKEQVIKRYEMLARYTGQLWELRVPININHLSSKEDLVAIIESFEHSYEVEYGKEAMIPTRGLEIITVAAEGIAATPKPQLAVKDYMDKDSSYALMSEKEVYFNGKWEKTKVYDISKLNAGNCIDAPAVIEARDTTIIIPPGWKASVDIYLNIIMECV